MNKALSKDGTPIAFDRLGEGPAIILVDGALCSRAMGPMPQLAARLAKDFTVFTYDRRGRNESGDTAPYAVEREVEDIEALLDEAGGSAYLYGVSSGAVLALRAAAQLGAARVPKVALFEPPFSCGEEAVQEFAAYTEQMEKLLQANRRGDAVTFFLGDLAPPEMLEEMRQSPAWAHMEAVAPTLAYESAVLGDSAVSAEIAGAVTMPALVLDGDASPAFIREAADALAAAMPHVRRITMEGQSHDAGAEAVAPVLREFFLG